MRFSFHHFTFPILFTALVGLNMPPMLAFAEIPARPAPESNAKEERNGQERVQHFLFEHGETLKAHRAEPKPSTEIQKLRDDLDALCHQKDCEFSELYWFTDLESAILKAKETGKPILSLRMLGRLDETLSCANSRFFRAFLYSNTEVSKLLRENFILHWESVAPVVKVTMDLGNGKKIETTTTGNSIHYILNANGEVVDALPGLYSPRAFLAHLQKALPVARESFKSEKSDEILKKYHEAELADLKTRWEKILEIAKLPKQDFPRGRSPIQFDEKELKARKAQRLVVSKSAVESPFLESFDPIARFEEEKNDQIDFWHQIVSADLTNQGLLLSGIVDASAAHTGIDENSAALILRQNPKPIDRCSKNALLGCLNAFPNLAENILMDTVQNEFRFRSEILKWLINPPPAKPEDTLAAKLSKLNDRIYRELFLMDFDDPWHGLGSPEQTFTGLPNGGVVED